MAQMPRRRPGAAGAVLASGALLITIATFMPWEPRLSGAGNYWD